MPGPLIGLYSITAAIAISLLFIGCKDKKEEGAGKGKQKDKMLHAEAFIVKPASLTTVYQSSGNLLPNESINVYPEVAGRITAIHFKEGAVVHKGDLLISMYKGDIEAQLQKSRVQRQLQVTTKERQDQLLAISGISKQDYDNTIAQIASIDADIAYNQALLRKLEIRATFNGVIGLRNVSVGAIISPTTLITTIQQVDPLKMDFLVPEQYKDIVNKNDLVKFTITGVQDTMNGTILAMQPGSDLKTHNITMRAMVPNAKGRLLPGAFTNVFITLNRKGDAITIPTQSIIPTTRDKQVAAIHNGKVSMVTIQTGERLADKVEVLEGLKSGDTILTTGMMQVKQDMNVMISKIRD